MNPPPRHIPSADLLVRKLQRFGPLSESERNQIRSLPSRVQEFGRGQVIIDQGEVTDESSLVLSGITFRYKLLPEGARQIVATQVPGDFVDLHSFVLKPLDHAIAAASHVYIAKVPHAAIQSMLDQQPRLARYLMWDMALDAASSREWLAALGKRTAYQQIAHLFCELYFRLDWAGYVKNASYEMPFTQAELADACGLSTVHVNRSLQSLRRDRLIMLENHALFIPDIGALIRAALFDPTYLHLQREDAVVS